MKRVGYGFLILLCGFLLLSFLGRGQPSSFPKDFPEMGITLIDQWVGDIDWLKDGSWIAYAKRNPRDWYMDVWKIRADGSDAQCLTCNENAPKKHVGSVTWHPSGKYIVFTAENEDVKTKKAEELATPGVGLNTNLWAMSSDGKQFWKLTNWKTDYLHPRGAIHPQFSHDGKRLFWAGPTGNYQLQKGYEWGEWALFLAEFSLEEGKPRLQYIRQFQPGPQHSFYESHDWSPDDRKVLFTANLQLGQSVNELDIYEYDLASQEWKNLTNTYKDWDEHAHYSPDGSNILWMSGAELNVKFRNVYGLNWAKEVKTELWIMNADGTGARRLTYFNQKGHPDWVWFQKNLFPTRRAIVSDSSFSPDGTKAAVCLAYEARWGQINSVLAILNLTRR